MFFPPLTAQSFYNHYVKGSKQYAALLRKRKVQFEHFSYKTTVIFLFFTIFTSVHAS